MKICVCECCKRYEEEAIAAIARRDRRDVYRNIAGSAALIVMAVGSVFVWAKWLW
jgi:hypothetical protein